MATGQSGLYVMVLILFCSFDALIAGIAYGYWSISLKEAAFLVGAVNFSLILLSFLTSGIFRYDVKT